MVYKSQKIANWYFTIALLLFVLQVAMGLWLISNYVFTIPQAIVDVFPFATARAMHTNLLVLWMLLGCDSGGARRSWLHGIEKVQKRYLIATMARNLGLLMRKLFALGTPKGLQAAGGLVSFVCLAWLHLRFAIHRLCGSPRSSAANLQLHAAAA